MCRSATFVSAVEHAAVAAAVGTSKGLAAPLLAVETARDFACTPVASVTAAALVALLTAAVAGSCLQENYAPQSLVTGAAAVNSRSSDVRQAEARRQAEERRQAGSHLARLRGRGAPPGLGAAASSASRAARSATSAKMGFRKSKRGVSATNCFLGVVGGKLRVFLHGQRPRPKRAHARDPVAASRCTRARSGTVPSQPLSGSDGLIASCGHSDQP